MPHRSHNLENCIFRDIVENAVDLIVIVDAQYNRTYVSPSAKEMLGHSPAELLGRHAFEFVHPHDLQRIQAIFARMGPDYPSHKETFRMRHATGRYIWCDARYRYLPATGGMLSILRDFTAQKITEERLAEANANLERVNATLQDWANIDGLTGLANRRSFDKLLKDSISQARRQAGPLGLVLLDVDYFKAFNDCYGHLGGDDCLRRVSECIRKALLRPGDLAARYGGEEIAVLLPATDAAGCAEMAERIRAAVTELRIEHSGSKFGVVTISGGAAAMGPAHPHKDCASLIGAADRALYQAKADGRNCSRLYNLPGP